MGVLAGLVLDDYCMNIVKLGTEIVKGRLIVCDDSPYPLFPRATNSGMIERENISYAVIDFQCSIQEVLYNAHLLFVGCLACVVFQSMHNCFPCVVSRVLFPVCCFPCVVSRVLFPVCCFPCVVSRVLFPVCCFPCVFFVYLKTNLWPVTTVIHKATVDHPCVCVCACVGWMKRCET